MRVLLITTSYQQYFGKFV